MSNSQIVVVVASNFESFIASMKSNLKLGYSKCEEATYLNGFFRARLVKETDEAYVARLGSISGEERENVLDLLDFLGANAVPITQEFVEEIKGLVKGVDVELDKPLQTEAVSLKVERKPRQRKAK